MFDAFGRREVIRWDEKSDGIAHIKMVACSELMIDKGRFRSGIVGKKKESSANIH